MKYPLRMAGFFALLAPVILAAASPAPPPADPTSSIAGKVVDAQGGPVAGAYVLLCDQKSGTPLDAETYRALSAESLTRRPNADFAHAATDDQGRFRFGKLPAGEYRLMAQSWKDAQPAKQLVKMRASIVELRGVADHVRLVPGSSRNVVLRPLGTGALRIDDNINKDGVFVVISTAPLRGDPILGVAAWGGAFAQGVIGATMKLRGTLTVCGLPAGKVHVALCGMSADDESSFGAGETEIQPDTATSLYVPVMSSWATGHPGPPQRLLPLIKEVESFGARAYKAQTIRSNHISWDEKAVPSWQNLWYYYREIARHMEREVELPSGGKASFGDVMAAVKYVEAQEYLGRLEEKQNRRKALEDARSVVPGVEQAGTYAEAFFDLYRELGENYPCFELKDIDWKAVGEEMLPRVKEVQTDEQFGLLCLELVARLEDSHAYLIGGKAQVPAIRVPRWDPGFTCLIDDRERPVVYYVDKEGPAEAAGVRVGMTVLSIGGEPAGKYMERRMKEIKKYSGYSSERYLRYHAAQWLGRQIDKGATVGLEMQDVKGKTRTFKLPATLGVRYLPRRPIQIEGTSDTANVSWTRLEGNIAYVYVRRISGDLIEKLDQAVGELKDARGLIVDVRGNSGGGFDARRAHRNFALDDDQEPQRPRFRGPIALLIDARCISAGEGWASWFIAEKRARLFGEATAGASARKRVYTLKNGLYQVRFPVKAYHGSLQRPIERRGLEPDVPLRQNAGDLAAGRDTVLEAAKRYLLEPES